MNSTPEPELLASTPPGAEVPASELPDPELIDARDLALAALREVTAEQTIGEPAGYRAEPDGALSLRFANRMLGYPGWFWTVSLARVEGSAPTVLEVELMPGEGALLAPEWTPWAERLAEYHAHQAELDQEALAAAAAGDESSDSDDEDDDDDSDDDIDDLDAADFDEDGSPILHSGDVDGVDIDSFSDDDDADDSDDDEDSDDDDDDSDDDDDEDSDDDDEDSDEYDSDDDEDDSDDDESDFQDPRVDRSY